MNYKCCNVTRLHPVKQIDEQAAYWLAKLVSNPLTAEEKTALQTWCKINHRHHQTLLELADVWDELDTLSELAALMPINQALDDKPSAVTDKRTYASGIVDFILPFRIPAAVLLIITGVLLLSINSIPPQSILNPPTLITQVGEKRSEILSDGSVVTLNTNTSIEINFTKRERHLTLLQGEAHFEVAKDKQRPFIVNIGGLQVRAVGTAFNIQKSLAHTEVIVTEGVIELDRTRPLIFSTDTVPPAPIASSPPQKKDGEKTNGEKNTTDRAMARYIKAGHVVILTQNAETIGKIEDNQLENQLAWQSGRLVFNGETLIQVIEEISRYTDRHFVFKDEAVKNIRVGGYFHIDNIDEMLDVLQAGFNINVSTPNAGVIYLSSIATRDTH